MPQIQLRKLRKLYAEWLLFFLCVCEADGQLKGGIQLNVGEYRKETRDK